MKINRSEIWYSYTTSFEGIQLSLDLISKLILISGITKSVVNSYGSYFYNDNGTLKEHNVKIESDPFLSSFKFDISNWPDDPFIKESLYQYHINHFMEQRVFSKEANNIDHNYVRFSLGEVILADEDGNIRLYPQITIYSSGIMNIEFRSINDFEIDLENFINSHLNLSSHSFKEAYIDSEIKLLNLKSDSQKAIYNDEVGDFAFKISKYDQSESVRLSQIALYYFDCICEILTSSLRKILKKKNVEHFEVGEIWFGKVHVHLLDFDNQADKSSDNILDNEIDIKRILTRVFYSKDAYSKNEEINDLRFFEDYNYIINSIITLSIWGNDGIESQKEWNDNNWNNYIYSNQVINRFLDYFQMLYKKSVFIVNKTKSLDMILQYQSDLTLLMNDFQHFGRSGEINELLKYAKDLYQIQYDEKIISSLLETKRIEIENTRNQDFNKLSSLLSIIFGLISSSSLANDFLYPLWKILRFPLFCSEELNEVVFWFCSFVIILIAIRTVIKGTWKRLFNNQLK